MARVYIAINGDDVGDSIGNAVASNDHMALSKLNTSLKDSHSMIEQWIQENGGETITSSGDEGIYVIPEEALDQLDSIRENYQQSAGHTLTIGVGSSMADASKALIYGKLNEKNQIVHYDPSIDDYLSEEQVEDAEDTQEQTMDAPEAGSYESVDPNEEPSEDYSEGVGEEEIEGTPEPQVPLDSGDKEDYSDDDNNIESPNNEVGEPNTGAAEAAVEEGSVDEYEKKDPQEKIEEIVTQEQEKESQMDPDQEVEHDAIEGEMDDVDDDNIEADAEPANEEDELVDMVHQDMEESGEDFESGDDMESDEMAERAGDDHSDLKAAIMDTLQIFRAHKQDLDMLGTANPELHSGLITMLQNMIEMGKRLQNGGAGGEQDHVGELNEFAEQFPHAEEDEHADAEEDQDMIEEEMDEHNEEMHDEDPDEDSAIEGDSDEEDETPFEGPDEDEVDEEKEESDDDSEEDDQKDKKEKSVKK